MKHVYRYLLFFLLHLFLFSGCQKASVSEETAAIPDTSLSEISAEDEHPLPPEENAISKELSKKHQLIAELPEHSLALYADSVTNAFFSDLSLQYGENRISLSGETLNNPFFPPELHLLEQGQTTAVFLLEGKGTGLYLMNLQLIRLADMQEYSYDNPISYLDQHFTSQITKEGSVSFSYDDKSFVFDVSEIEAPENLNEMVGYGEHILYFIEDDILYCDLALTYSPSSIFGAMRLTYTLTEEGYKVCDMEFEAYSDNKISFVEED